MSDLSTVEKSVNDSIQDACAHLTASTTAEDLQKLAALVRVRDFLERQRKNTPPNLGAEK